MATALQLQDLSHGKADCYYRARYYDAAAGHFLSEDPDGFNEGTDFYAYVRSNPTTLVDPSGRFVEVLCERVHQYGLGYWVNGPGIGARHCRLHVRCDECKSKRGRFDATYELTGYGPGALRPDNFDPSRPVTNRVPVMAPPMPGNCAFENCLVDRFMFHYLAASQGQNTLPDYNPVNANSNAFVYSLVKSCGGGMSYPDNFWSGFFGEMPNGTPVRRYPHK